MKNCLYLTIFDIISRVADKSGSDVYVIGGFVRDCILKRRESKKDVDILVIGDGIALAKEIANTIKPGLKVSYFKNFGTAMFRHKGYEIEFVGARKESYSKDSRKPFVKPGTLDDDLRRRDFTINALAICLNKDRFGEFIDPFGGIDDLNNKVIRTPLDPDKTFSDDPLRMMRAIRFASQLDFNIDSDTFASIKKNAHRISIVSKERITSELNKIMMTKAPSRGLRILYESDLLKFFLPELHDLKGVEYINKMGHKDNFDHTIQVVDNVSMHSDNLYLRWAALLHDIAKPVTKKYSEESGWSFHGHEFIGSKMIPGIFKRLRLPLNENMKYVQKLVNLHLRPIILSQDIVSDSAVRRLLFEAGNDIDDLMILCEADITSKNERKVKQHLQNFGLVRQKLKDIEARDHIRNFQPPVSGEEIMSTFNLKPGPMVGIIKEKIKEAILDGEIPNNYEEAIKLMHAAAREIGLSTND